MEETNNLSMEEQALMQQLLAQPNIADYPTPKKHEDVLKILKEVINFKDEDWVQITKTGNVREHELGNMPLNVRVYLNIAGYANAEGLSLVSNYLRAKSNIINASSLSLKGMLLNLIVTDKRITKNMGAVVREKKTGLFGSTERTEGEE